MEKDCREWTPTIIDPRERSTCRSGVCSVMRAASLLPGRGLTDVDDTPAPARYLNPTMMMICIVFVVLECILLSYSF